MMSIAGGHASANTHINLTCCNGLPRTPLVLDSMTSLISRWRRKFSAPKFIWHTVKMHIWAQGSKPTMHVGVSFWPACTKACMSSIETYPHTNAAIPLLIGGQTLHKHVNTKPKCNCCKLCPVQQFCCPNCTLKRSAAADHPYSISWKITTKWRSSSKDKVGTIKKHVWGSIHCCLHERQHAGWMWSTRNKGFWWHCVTLSTGL